jgi:hypothetical protein
VDALHECSSIKSAGVIAVSLTEVQEQQLQAVADGVRFQEHCSIDFTGLAKTDVEKKAKLLASYAVTRGWQFQRTA